MGRINILDKHVAELIAAGEVVERPSSVIKELVENSIDAGATAVTVEIKNGGVTFMRVSDNGCGILREDVRPAFVRHATSKVRGADDLDAIATLGFRGEALASVSSVSHLELITKAHEEETGTRCVIEGGEEVSFSEAGCPDGTTFIIRDLFYNVPARMKFLKTDMSEGNAVSNVIDKIALSHPEIAITYIKDGKTVLRTAGDGKLLSAIYAVYGRDFASSLIPVDYTLDGIRVSGYLSRPQNARPNRNMQNFFINHRFVICKTAMAAIGEACKGVVMVGKFPSCVINIDVAFGAVDVNVHPTKLEVRFVNERPIFDAVYHAVKTALMNGDKPVEVVRNAPMKNRVNPFELAQKVFRERDEEKKAAQTPAPDEGSGRKAEAAQQTPDELFRMLDTAEEKQEFAPDHPVEEKKDDDAPRVRIEEIAADQAAQPGVPIVDQYKRMVKDHLDSVTVNWPDPLTRLSENSQKKEKPTDPEDDPTDEPISDSAPLTFIETDDDGWRYIGEAFKTYIIIEKNPRELVLIDKHAAHERIIFDKLWKRSRNSAQYLFTPITVTLDKMEYNAALREIDVFTKAGFQIEDFGGGSVIVRAAPQYLDEKDIEMSVIEMAGYLSENRKEILTEKMRWILSNIACRAAVKGGNINSKSELIALAKQVEDEDVRHCPHGRPVAVVVKKSEIERWFKRG